MPVATVAAVSPQKGSISTPMAAPQAPLPPQVLAQTAPPVSPAKSPDIAVSAKTSAPSGAASNILANWPQFCKKLPPSIRFICAKARVEEINGMLKISCDNEASRALLEGKTMTIREALADFFSLETPPNLAIEVSEAYSKSAEVTQASASQSQVSTLPAAEPEPTIPADWASFAQEVVGGEDF